MDCPDDEELPVDVLVVPGPVNRSDNRPQPNVNAKKIRMTKVRFLISSPRGMTIRYKPLEQNGKANDDPHLSGRTAGIRGDKCPQHDNIVPEKDSPGEGVRHPAAGQGSETMPFRVHVCS